MMRSVPFEMVHLDNFEIQEAQKNDRVPGDAEALAACEYPVTVLSEDNKVVLCAGFRRLGPHRALAWVLISKYARGNMPELTAMTRAYLDNLPYKRLEALADCGFEKGMRWLETLGFTCEAPKMRFFGDDLRDHALFARVKE
jgi:hypothetical protein